MSPLPPRLRRNAVPEYLLTKYGIEVSKQTLSTWAYRGGGPRFQKYGNRVLYPVDELDAWAVKRLGPVVSSTSELAMADHRSEKSESLPNGIQTFDTKSDSMARKLAKDPSPARIERKHLGEQLIREATEAFRPTGKP